MELSENEITYFNWDFSYLTFDTQFKLKCPIRNFIPFATVGPRIDYLLNYSDDFRIYHWEVDKVNYGARYGIGVSYERNKLGATVGYHRNFSLNPVVANIELSNKVYFDIVDKTSVLYVGVSYSLN